MRSQVRRGVYGSRAQQYIEKTHETHNTPCKTIGVYATLIDWVVDFRTVRVYILSITLPLQNDWSLFCDHRLDYSTFQRALQVDEEIIYLAHAPKVQYSTAVTVPQ